MIKNYKLVGAICGVLAPVLFTITYAISWSLSPWYVFGGNYFSDLGVGEGALAYNAGAITAGILAIPFALSLWKTLEPGRLTTIGSSSLVVSGVFLVSVGVFTEDFGILHTAVSGLFFLLVFITAILLAWPLTRSLKFRRAGTVATALVLGTVCVVAVVGINPLGETIAIIVILAWTLILAIQTLRVVIKPEEPLF
jgi:hypothetical membrane protein